MNETDNKKKKKILVMADANFLAHVSRAFEVAKVLKKDFGHEVVFSGDGAFMRLPRDEGMTTDWVFTVPRNATMKLANRATLVNYSWWRDIIVKSIESDVACINRHKPDLVLGDMHWSLSTSCEVARVPYVTITNAHWTNYFSFIMKSLNGHITTRYFGSTLAAKIMPAFKKLTLQYWGLPYWKFRRDHGLPENRSRNLLDVVEGDITLLADIPEYGRTLNAPPHYKYVGPILWDMNIPDPQWLKDLDPERPTLYFTMGSTGDPLFFEKAIRIFGNTKYQIVMTTGGLPVSIPRVPPNFYIEEFAPGDRIVEKSHLVVNHGGNGSIYQALAGGVPIIGAPYHVDQDLNLQLVESLGCGIRLKNDRFLFDRLEKAIEEILSNMKYRKNARAIQRIINNYGGARQAAHIIEDYLNL